ncbi:MAG TPA: enterotoxin [Terriglobales bacterium]
MVVSCESFIGQEAVYFKPDPGPAQAQNNMDGISLSNSVLEMSWRLTNNSLVPLRLVDRISKQSTSGPLNAFVLILQNGRVVSSTDLKISGIPKVESLAGDKSASRFSERVPGKAIVLRMEDNDQSLEILWKGILRDGGNYVRQELTLTAQKTDVPIRAVRLIDWELPDAEVVGRVKGSPVVGGNVFVGFENPLSGCTVGLGRTQCNIARELPLRAGTSVTYSSVVGVSPAGQMRRAFLHYVERERAHPYRTFLHYNSWYDLGYFNRFNEKDALEAVRAIGGQLHVRRKVTLDSYLFDDGWDDPSTLWHFNAGFPNGFTGVRRETEKFGAEPGVWMSPWGGYGKPKQMRVAAAEKAGLEVVNNGLALSGPKYYKLFRDTCLTMMREYGVNQFKFDGTGNADRVVAGSEFDSDFDAAIHLIRELRSKKPDLYVNLTTGTYPSPFWLEYADSIWRGGEDHEFLGVGTSRQRWITYRDADTYEHVVMDGPLFPLNSLMLHGIIYAKQARDLNTDPGDDFESEVRDYFGTGTQLQEMYITPSLLSQQNWDSLAEAANWSRENADVLVDTHWIGGDPALLEVYGWASWSPRKGILVLRNPRDKGQSISVDLARAFELPQDGPASFTVHSPWKEDEGRPLLTLDSHQAHRFILKPFEVVVLEAIPNK